MAAGWQRDLLPRWRWKVDGRGGEDESSIRGYWRAEGVVLLLYHRYLLWEILLRCGGRRQAISSGQCSAQRGGGFRADYRCAELAGRLEEMSAQQSIAHYRITAKLGEGGM